MVQVTVWCIDCDKYKDEKDVKFLNIEENIFGEDVLTFQCPDCGTEQQSIRRG